MRCCVCGKKSLSEYCFHHKPRKHLTKSVNSNNEESSKMWEFFMNIWTKRRDHRCENCGKPLGNTPFSYMFDHILEKGNKKYEFLKYNEDNLIYLCLECHDKKSRRFITDLIRERIELIKTKYNLL